jgi:hypothetical protein
MTCPIFCLRRAVELLVYSDLSEQQCNLASISFSLSHPTTWPSPNFQDQSNPTPILERGLTDRDGRGVHRDGAGHAGLPLYRLGRGRRLLRRASGGHRADSVGAVRAQVLRPHLQHPHPEPAPRLLPLLGPPRRPPLRRAGHPGARRRQHLRRRALLPPRVRRHGGRLRRRVRAGRPALRQDETGVRQDPREQEVVVQQVRGGAESELAEGL